MGIRNGETSMELLYKEETYKIIGACFEVVVF